MSGTVFSDGGASQNTEVTRRSNVEKGISTVYEWGVKDDADFCGSVRIPLPLAAFNITPESEALNVDPVNANLNAFDDRLSTTYNSLFTWT